MRPMIRNVAFLTAVVFLAACQDRTPTAPSNAIEQWRAAQANPTASLGTCALNQAALNALTDLVFGGGGPNSNSVKSKIDQVVKAMAKNDTKQAAKHAFDAVRFIFQKFKGPQKLAGTSAQVGQLISGIFCIAGINITVEDPANASVVDPANTTQTVTSSDTTAGTQLPPGSITEPTVLEFHAVVDTFTVPGRGPLNTRLDQYPGFFLITAGTASGDGPAAPVVVAICPDATVPSWVRARLRLGHEKTTGFEITPPADASFLKCPAPPAVGFLPGWMNKALGMLLPRTLYAAQEEEPSRGVGGLATEFSPFDPVDTELSFDRGVGGLATEFKRSGTGSATLPFGPSMRRSTGNAGGIAMPGANASVTIPPAPACAAGFPWSTQVTPECRPDIVLRTRLGTFMRDVPISWTIGIGGGTIAVAPACATFGSSAATTTDADGRSSVCWTLGSTPGLNNNTVTATPSVGGDAAPGVVFVPTTGTFTATAIMRTPVATAVGAITTYDGLDHPGSGTCSESLTPVLSYSSGSVPNDVGVDTLTVTCGDGNVLYNTVTANAIITVTALRVAGVGANAGLRAADTVFATGDLPGAITRLNTTQFNALSPDSLRKLFDVLIITWSSPTTLDVDWATRLLPYLQLGGGVIYEDPNNVGDLAAVIGAAVVNVGGENPTGITVTPVPRLTDGIAGLFDNNHIRFTSFATWSPVLSPFLTYSPSYFGGAVVGLYGRFGAGCIVLTGPDQDYHAQRGDNQYKLLLNELRFVRSCP